MVSDDEDFDLEARIDEWKAFLASRPALRGADVEELESHLRDEIDGLRRVGLAADEAFLIGARRLGSLDALTREYATVHSGRLWRNLIFSAGIDTPDAAGRRHEFLWVLALAVGAALAIKLPVLFGIALEANPSFYLRNFSLFAFPFLAAYFVQKRQLRTAGIKVLVPLAVLATLFANAYPYAPFAATELLTALHLPIALWFVVGVFYTGDWWGSEARRMDFVRFSGEFTIYYVLIALGGGVLGGFTLGIFSVIGVDLEWLLESWILPCGAMGAALVAAWLVEAKQAAIENMAPVLCRVFTPLFTLSLLSFLVTMAVTGSGIDVQREVLIAFDLLLVLVLGLVLYAVSSRDPGAPPGWFDRLQLLLVFSALLVNFLALLAIAGRLAELGFTPNRVAALGENLVLLVALAGYGWHYWRFLAGEAGFAALERWQTGYIPVYAAWAAVVVIVFPPLFGFN